MPSLHHRVAGQSGKRLVRAQRRQFRICDHAARPRSPRTHGRNRASRAVTVAGPGSTFSAPYCFVLRLSVMTPGHFLGGGGRHDATTSRVRIAIWLAHQSPFCALWSGPLFPSPLAEFIAYRIALLVFWFNIFAAGIDAPLELELRDPRTSSLPRFAADIHPAVVRRIVIVQSLYAAGAALGFSNTYSSIAAIVLVQGNSAIAPRLCRSVRKENEAGRTTSLRPGIAAQRGPG